VSNIINIQEPKPRKHKRISRKKRVIIIAIVVIVFAGGVISGWFFVSYQLAVQRENNSKELIKLFDDADKLVNTGKTDQAIAAYDVLIKKTNNTDQKASLLLNKATLYKQNKNYDKALTIAKEAESYSPKNSSVAGYIAQTYAEKGDKKNAIIYYKKAISLVDKTSPMSGSDITDYQNMIKSLGGTI